MRNFTKVSALLLSLSIFGQVHAYNKCDVMLKQSDFNEGTYIIQNPGKYCLQENISFNPNSVNYLNANSQYGRVYTAYESAQPRFTYMGGKYDPAAYSLGFFAAIAVAAPDVTIDLQGKTIEQSKEHALLQRFFAVIETADRPFIHGQGPSDFGTIVGAAENLVIKNGKIGRSAHHGIHGNRAKNVTIKNIQFEDFEVAAVAMNGVDGLHLENLTAKSREDVPVLGQFSTAQFIKHYVDALVYKNANISFNNKTIFEIQADLKNAINNVYEDLIESNKETIDPNLHLSEWKMFHNKEGIVDGNAYGFLINGVGVAVNGFPTTQSTDSPSRNVTFKNVKLKSLKANIREIITLSTSNDTQVNDPVGSLFQVLAVDPTGLPLTLTELNENGRYLGNVVTNAQAIVAKAIAQGMFHGSPVDVSRNSISMDLVNWAESGAPLSSYLAQNSGPHGTGFICNTDQMFHVNKGVVGFKLDGAENVTMENSGAFNIENIGKAGSSLCGDYQFSHPAATLEGYGGAVTRGVSLSGSTDVTLKNTYLKRVYSHSGDSIGVDIQTDSSSILIERLRVKSVYTDGLGSSSVTSQVAMPIRVSSSSSDIEIN